MNPNVYLDYLARCRQAFTPFAPIELPDFFAGRAHVIEDIRGELEAPGRQVAIYGERGVGKTSLALKQANTISIRRSFGAVASGAHGFLSDGWVG